MNMLLKCDVFVFITALLLTMNVDVNVGVLYGTVGLLPIFKDSHVIV